MAFFSAIQRATKAHEDEVADLQAQIRMLESKSKGGGRESINHLDMAACTESHDLPCQALILGGVSNSVRRKACKPRTPRCPVFPAASTPKTSEAVLTDARLETSHRAVITSDSLLHGDASQNSIKSFMKQQTDLSLRLDHFLNYQETLIQSLLLQSNQRRIPKTKRGPKDISPMWQTTVSIDANLRQKAREEVRKEMAEKMVDGIVPEEEAMPSMCRLLRSRVKSLVAGSYFDLFFTVAILCSSAILGWQVQYAAANQVNQSPLLAELADGAFTVLFTIELAMRVFAKGWSVFWSRNDWMWHWLDFLVVASSLFELILTISSSKKSSDSSMPSLTAFRAARLLRVTRIVRVFRVVRIVAFIRALRVLVSSIVYTLKSLAWAMLLLSLIVYVFGLIFTQAYVDYSLQHPEIENVALQKYWGSLGNSMLTLLQAITGGLSWEVAADEMRDIHLIYLLLLLVYIIFAAFAVLNVMTAVFCQSAMESAQRDTDIMIQLQLQRKESYCERVRHLFKQLDDDNSGAITIHEFEQCMDSNAVKALFETMDMEVDDAWVLFKLLDSDKTGVLDIDEFVEGCCRLRGTARRVDIAKLNHESSYLCKTMRTLSRFLEAYFDEEFREVSKSPGDHSSQCSHYSKSADSDRHRQEGELLQNTYMSTSRQLS